MKTSVEKLLEILAKNGTLHNSDIEQALEIEVNLAEQFAEFSILCDRSGMNPIKFKDWCNQYNKKKPL
jgi:hypothetical protein